MKSLATGLTWIFGFRVITNLIGGRKGKKMLQFFRNVQYCKKPGMHKSEDSKIAKYSELLQ